MISLSGWAQPADNNLTGRVVDEQGEPLIGVSVYIRGTSVGTTTDIDGTYTLPLGNRQKAMISFSYVGMKSQDISISNSQRKLDAKMQSDTDLETVIVQGYGRVQKREDLVGSAFQINAKDMEFKPATRLENILDGMIPGLTIDPNTDGADAVRSRMNIRIRGEASLGASNEPLWIIDGVPVYTGGATNMVAGMSTTISPLSFINPADVESITVLKDASEVAIYGADGANGVILVTTKGGKLGNKATTVTATLRFGIKAIDESTRFKTLNASQYLAYAKEAWANSGNDMRLFPYQDNELNSYSTTDTDWHKLYYGIGNTMQADVSISGGSETSGSRFSVGYYREKGTVKGNTQQRITMSLNNTYKLGKRLLVQPSLSASYNINDVFSPGSSYYENLPIYSPFDKDGYTYRLYNRSVESLDKDGNPIWKDVRFLDNGIAKRDLNDNKQKTFETTANLTAQYEILNGLTASAQFGAKYQHSYETLYASRLAPGDGIIDGEPKGYSTRASANFLTWTNSERVNFNRKFGKHTVKALAGIELSSQDYNTLAAWGSGFINDQIQEIQYAEDATRKGISNVNTRRSLSFFGEAGYTYDSRYTVQFNFRREGNSDFGKSARWGNYFSVAGAWNIQNEKFFHSEVIKMLKLKASFGTSGNSRVGSAQMRGLGTFVYGNSYSYNGIIGGVVGSAANPGLSWEKTYMTNVGVDIQLWDRLSIGAEYYYYKTKDMLSKVYTSSFIGDARIYANIGEMNNMGAELSISSTNIQRPNFSWTTNFNMAHNRNRVTKLADGKPISTGSSITAVGHDVNTFNLIRWAGVDPTTGAPMWYDKNGDLTYTYSTDNRVIGKSASPKVTGSLSNTFRLYNFSLGFMLNYSIGGHRLATLGTGALRDGYNIIAQNVSVNSLDHWSKPGDISANPRISTVTSQSSMNSTRFLTNSTNFRLQSLSLTYALPKEISRKMHMSSCRVSFLADNLFLWTLDQKHGKNSFKTTMYGYPVQRTFSLSLDMSF